MAPEVLKKQGATLASDIWSLGIMTFQMRAGHLPFTGKKQEIYQQIKDNEIEWPYWIENDCKDFITSLLKVQIKERPAFPEIFQHPFLAGINFDKETSEILESLNTYNLINVCKGALITEPDLDPILDRWENKEKPMLTGFLSKTNRYGIKQRRYFVLYREGEIHYFKMKGNNVKERTAVLNLIPGTRAVKAGKKSLILEAKERKVELSQPDKHYQLLQPASKSFSFSCDIDNWIENINFCIENI